MEKETVFFSILSARDRNIAVAATNDDLILSTAFSIRGILRIQSGLLHEKRNMTLIYDFTQIGP